MTKLHNILLASAAAVVAGLGMTASAQAADQLSFWSRLDTNEAISIYFGGVQVARIFISRLLERRTFYTNSAGGGVI